MRLNTLYQNPAFIDTILWQQQNHPCDIPETMPQFDHRGLLILLLNHTR